MIPREVFGAAPLLFAREADYTDNHHAWNGPSEFRNYHTHISVLPSWEKAAPLVTYSVWEDWYHWAWQAKWYVHDLESLAGYVEVPFEPMECKEYISDYQIGNGVPVQKIYAEIPEKKKSERLRGLDC